MVVAIEGGNFIELRQKIVSEQLMLKCLTFSSDRKRMTTIIKLSSNSVRVFCKGAAEIVLGLCTQMLTPSGDIVALSDDKVCKLILWAKYLAFLLACPSDGVTN